MPVQRAPMPRPMPNYPVMGMGQEGAPLITVQQCSKTGPALVGFLAGAVTVGIGCGVYCYFRKG